MNPTAEQLLGDSAYTSSRQRLIGNAMARIERINPVLKLQTKKVHAGRRDACAAPFGDRLRSASAHDCQLRCATQIVNELRMDMVHDRKCNCGYSLDQQQTVVTVSGCNLDYMEDDYIPPFAAFIRAKRESMGMNYSQVAKAAGKRPDETQVITRQAVMKWEKGSVEDIKLSSLKALAHVFGLRLADLAALFEDDKIAVAATAQLSAYDAASMGKHREIITLIDALDADKRKALLGMVRAMLTQPDTPHSGVKITTEKSALSSDPSQTPAQKGGNIRHK